ncbi:BON domain-containing protein [Agromyces aurantiacus]|uniref:BON domain-containing protein n=1 Tax=Agromyces aurantiacus TaxID=165814 RepID=A0ABV9R3A6_9MICO|nr:BON domain-containing protein [Agromyces aurantiacus]MBM7502972.1 osmotically-inducible protein OsmY [Agromyces aurantiacus]
MAGKYTDDEIQRWVEEELEWTPGLDSAGIGVSVVDGAVRLSGEVGDLSDRADAIRAAERVQGVTTVIDDLEVTVRGSREPDETELAHAVQREVAWVGSEPNSVRAEVHGRDVVLTGEVEFNFQRDSVRHAVARIPGVHSVESRIALRRRPSADDTAERIRRALVRHAIIDANHVDVQADGTTVRLTGFVSSYLERAQAEEAAWASPHVEHVENHLAVVP